MKTEDIKKLDRQHVIYSWKAQRGVDPIIMDRAEGIYNWDTDGKRFIDFCAGLLCVNIGHGNLHILGAMKKQMEKLTYVATMVIALSLAAVRIPGEIERRTAYNVLARPVRRWEYVVGTWLGMFATIAGVVAAFTVVDLMV